MAEDLSFTFNTDVFKRGIAEVTKGMDSMQTSATTVAKGISKGFNAVIGKLAIIKGAFVAIKGALNNMPEIGQAFGIAKDIFVKNLLFPLRKQIMPLLQRMLDWVRDSRTMFIKWGQTLANIFRAVTSAFKTLIEFTRQTIKNVSTLVGNLFGDTIGSFDNLLNILSFKLAVAFEFLKLIAKPLREAIEPIIKLLTTVITAFTGGFLEGIAGIEGPLKRIFESMSGIVDALFTGEGPLKFWKDVFEGLGFVIGTTIRLAFEGIAIVLETIETVIQKIKDFFTSEAFNTFIENTVKLFEAVGKNLEIGAAAQKEAGFTGGGRAQLAATPVPIGVAAVTNSVDLSGLIINVTDTENPDDLGPKIGNTIVDFFRDAYDSDFTKGGQ